MAVTRQYRYAVFNGGDYDVSPTLHAVFDDEADAEHVKERLKSTQPYEEAWVERIPGYPAGSRQYRLQSAWTCEIKLSWGGLMGHPTFRAAEGTPVDDAGIVDAGVDDSNQRIAPGHWIYIRRQGLTKEEARVLALARADEVCLSIGSGMDPRQAVRGTLTPAQLAEDHDRALAVEASRQAAADREAKQAAAKAEQVRILAEEAKRIDAFFTSTKVALYDDDKRVGPFKPLTAGHIVLPDGYKGDTDRLVLRRHEDGATLSQVELTAGRLLGGGLRVMTWRVPNHLQERGKPGVDIP